jgi:hypothetical protein
MINHALEALDFFIETLPKTIIILMYFDSLEGSSSMPQMLGHLIFVK